MSLQHAALAALLAMALAGCTAPGGAEVLKTTAHLDEQAVERIDNVSGTVEVWNPTAQEVRFWPFACPNLAIRKTTDQEMFLAPCPFANDVAEPTILGPGERTVRDFSFVDRTLRGQDNERVEEPSLGDYALSAHAVRDAPRSEEVLFSITG